MKRLIVIMLVIFSLLGMSGTSNAQVAVGVSVGIAPPALPVYEQPPCPGDGYMWCPGYWAWGPDGYYWVPGVWVIDPEVGFLWTPGYWAFIDGGYYWQAGYWGPHIGFYGGVCYGYGYWGHGFGGGRWEGGYFRYNTAAWHVGGGVHNTYVDRTVIVNNSNRTSFNGRGGIEAQPTAEERTAMSEHHIQPTAVQRSHEHSASMNRSQYASVNHGNPRTTARSTAGGARYNSAGHAIASHPAAAHPNNNATAHPANAPRPQVQQHTAMQSRPAQQHMAPHTMQRVAPQPMRSAPMGGGHLGGGGGGHERH